MAAGLRNIGGKFGEEGANLIDEIGASLILIDYLEVEIEQFSLEPLVFSWEAV